MFNFIKKKEGIASNIKEQNCCCGESIEVESKQETSCSGCSCGKSTQSYEENSCCRK